MAVAARTTVARLLPWLWAVAVGAGIGTLGHRLHGGQPPGSDVAVEADEVEHRAADGAGDDASAATAGTATEPLLSPQALEHFERRVRPLLVEHCHQCHGPEKQEGGLRLDARSAILAGGDTGPAIVPGDPDESLLVDAVRYGDLYQMPPTGKLPPEAIESLTTWVRDGAAWPAEDGAGAAPQEKPAFRVADRADHWSLEPLAVVELPAVRQHAWPVSPIDRFILAGLEAAGLEPAPAADRAVLVRRLSLDLTGLPPSPEEVQAFVADEAPDALERLVDRLLASPRYGERWARHWLDLVRYAETLGHEFDYDIPHAWRYRDYVIRALNDDLPYDQFVREHLAGDLLPAPRLDPREGYNLSVLGTAFFWLGEQTHSPVDVRQHQADRVDNQIDTLAKTFLGLTVSCARCHDHKFDAISTADYYALAAVVRSTRYEQTALDPGGRIAAGVARLGELASALDRTAHALYAPLWTAEAGPLAGPLDKPLEKHLDEQLDEPLARHLDEQFDSAAADWQAWRDAARVLADFAAHSSDWGGWRATGAAFGPRPTQPGEVLWGMLDDTWLPSANATADATSADTTADAAAAAASDTDETAAAAVLPAVIERHGRAHSGRAARALEGALRSPTFTIDRRYLYVHAAGRGGRINVIVEGLNLIRDPIYGRLTHAVDDDAPRWYTIDLEMWAGQQAYVELVDSVTPNLTQSLSQAALGHEPGDGYLAVDDVWLADQPPPAMLPRATLPPAMLPRATLPRVVAHTSQPPLERPVGTLPKLAQRSAADAIEQLVEQFAVLLAEYRAVAAAIPGPLRAPAATDADGQEGAVFVRGNYRVLGEPVPRRFLEVFGGNQSPLSAGGSGRLELADALLERSGPLVARVIVNRVWQHHFGVGLVSTPDDFGVMGQPPTHPELLDWLADRLIRERWSLKALHRLLVLSSTYQMSSRADGAAAQVDPANRLYHRMHVRRLEAEAVRDSLLAVSGRLDQRLYGPSVAPHLTPFMSGRGRPAHSGPLDGDGRRSLYLNVRRNFLSPLLVAYDFPAPFATVGRRGTSNVPAQALSMMNNPLVIQQAQAWARRLLARDEPGDHARLERMYLEAFARGPTRAEATAALAFLGASGEDVGSTDGPLPVSTDGPVPLPTDGPVPLPTDGPAASPDERLHRWSELAHALLNLREFVFVP